MDQGSAVERVFLPGVDFLGAHARWQAWRKDEVAKIVWRWCETCWERTLWCWGCLRSADKLAVVLYPWYCRCVPATPLVRSQLRQLLQLDKPLQLPQRCVPGIGWSNQVVWEKRQERNWSIPIWIRLSQVWLLALSGRTWQVAHWVAQCPVWCTPVQMVGWRTAEIHRCVRQSGWEECSRS